MPPADAPGFCKEICRFQRPKSGAVNAKTKSILAFTINDKKLKRAGLDYWPKLKLFEYKSYEDFLEKHPEVVSEEPDLPRLWYATTKASKTYADVSYGQEDFIMFGKETAGIPEEILAKNLSSCVRIPRYSEERSLNLSNAATVILYEALRQNGFRDLEKKGFLGGIKD